MGLDSLMSNYARKQSEKVLTIKVFVTSLFLPAVGSLLCHDSLVYLSSDENVYHYLQTFRKYLENTVKVANTQKSPGEERTVKAVSSHDWVYLLRKPGCMPPNRCGSYRPVAKAVRKRHSAIQDLLKCISTEGLELKILREEQKCRNAAATVKGSWESQ